MTWQAHSSAAFREFPINWRLIFGAGAYFSLMQFIRASRPDALDASCFNRNGWTCYLRLN